MSDAPATTAAEASLAAVFAAVESQRERSLARLLAYLRMPSISAHGEGMAEVAAALVAQLDAIGMHPQTIATPGWPFVYARRDDAPGAPTVLLYGHYDVQPPDPLDAWVSPPFAPTIRDGRVYARGAGDNKGQHFAQLLAIETLLAVHGRLPCNVIVLLEGEEEIGSPHIAAFVRDNRAILDADLVVTADGPLHASGRPTLEFGVRGVASFGLHARGATTDLHSGNWGGVAPNPIWTLVHLLATMKNDRGEITIDGLHDGIVPPSERELAALAALPDDIPQILASVGLTRMDAPAERGYYERLAFHPTLTINGFHGGYGGPGSKTVLPHEAFVTCDIRLVADQRVETVMARVAAHVASYAPDVIFEPHAGMDPSKTPLDSPFAPLIAEALARGMGDVPLWLPAMGGSLPEYVWTRILGVPAFVTPYANADEANHAPNENIEVERFFAGIRTGAALLTLLGERRL